MSKMIFKAVNWFQYIKLKQLLYKLSNQNITLKKLSKSCWKIAQDAYNGSVKII